MGVGDELMRIRCNSARYGHGDRLFAPDCKRVAGRLTTDALHENDSVFDPRIGQQRHELLAAVAAEPVDLTGRGPQDIGELLQHPSRGREPELSWADLNRSRSNIATVRRSPVRSARSSSSCSRL